MSINPNPMRLAALAGILVGGFLQAFVAHSPAQAGQGQVLPPNPPPGTSRPAPMQVRPSIPSFAQPYFPPRPPARSPAGQRDEADAAGAPG